MERALEPKMSALSQFISTYSPARGHSYVNVYPQMPGHQIQYFVKQAVRKNHLVTIQLNPTEFKKDFTEVTGLLSLSQSSSHVILTPDNEQTVYLIQPCQIRHLRLASSY